MSTPRKPRGVGPLTALEASHHIGIHKNTLLRIPPQELPFFRINPRGDRRYLVEDLDAYIAARMAVTR